MSTKFGLRSITEKSDAVMSEKIKPAILRSSSLEGRDMVSIYFSAILVIILVTKIEYSAALSRT